MNKRVSIGPNLELVVIESLTFKAKDAALRKIVEQGYFLQVQALLDYGSTAADALHPMDSIGSSGTPGILTDKDDPTPGYHHLYLGKNRPDGSFDLIGMRVTEERSVPGLGQIIAEWYAPLVRAKDERTLYVTEAGMQTTADILWSFEDHLSKPMAQFQAIITDGKGINKPVLSEHDYHRIGPGAKTIFWAPPLNADSPEKYKESRPVDMFIRFLRTRRPQLSERAVRWLGEDYLEANTELNEELQGLMGFRSIRDLPAYNRTMEAIAAVSKANNSYIPCGRILLSQFG